MFSVDRLPPKLIRFKIICNKHLEIFFLQKEQTNEKVKKWCIVSDNIFGSCRFDKIVTISFRIDLLRLLFCCFSANRKHLGKRSMYSSRFSRKLILLQPGRIISWDMCRWRQLVIVFVLLGHYLSVTLTYASRSIQSAYIRIRGASVPQKGIRTGSTFTLSIKVTLFERNNLNLDVFGQDQ